MRKIDKIKNIKKVNILLEKRVLLIKEGFGDKFSNKRQIANAINNILSYSLKLNSIYLIRKNNYILFISNDLLPQMHPPNHHNFVS